jgi:hypothetical protein
MITGVDWRRKFIELSEAIFRELGFEVPAILHDDNLPLAMELEYAGMEFELLHSSTEMEDRFLVNCHLGLLPDEHVTRGLRQMLQANLQLARMHKACYGVDPDKQQVKAMYYENLSDVSARSVLENMREISSGASNWRDEFFSPAHAGMNMTLPATQYRLA